MTTATKPQSSNRRTRPTRKPALTGREAADTLQQIVTPRGWTVTQAELPTGRSAVQPDAIQNWLLADPSDNTLVCPDECWQAIQPSAQLCLRHLPSMNDAKAILSLLFETRKDFATECADPAGQLVQRTSPTGTVTKFGTVYAEGRVDPVSGVRDFRVWIGRKAGMLPALEGEAGIQVIRNLVRASDREDTPGCAAVDNAAVSDARPVTVTTKRATRKPAEPKTRPHSSTPAAAGKLKMVPLFEIRPAANNHRKDFDRNALQELAESITQHGILQPLLVRPVTADDRSQQSPLLNYPETYVLIAGERRYRAAQLAGLTEVPVMVQSFGQLQSSLAMLEENIRRVDLNPIERAQAIHRLVTEHQLSQKEVGRMIGCTQGQVSNELRLLTLPAGLQQLVSDGIVAPTAIRVLLPVADIPPVMDEMRTRITNQHTAGQPIEATWLSHRLTDAIRQHSRPMTYEADWCDWQKPDPKRRHFKTLSAENEAALDVRDFACLSAYEGKRRTFNCTLFDQLNKIPLANRREKHGKRTAANRSGAKPSDKSKTEELFRYEWAVRNAVDQQLVSLLADALEQCTDKSAMRLVCLALTVLSECGLSEALCGREFRLTESPVGPLLETLNVSDNALITLLRSTLVKELRGRFRLEAKESIELAQALGRDLLAHWTPSDGVLEQLTDAGRQTLEAAAGQIPDFLRPFFGLPERKAKKAGKKKAG